MAKTAKCGDNYKVAYYPKLPSAETIMNLVIYSGVIFGSIFTLLSSSRENEQKYFSYGRLKQGWKTWLGHYKDTSDSEWSFWEKHLWRTVVLGFTGHFIVSRFADAFLPKYRFKLYFLYSLVYTIFFLGVNGLMFMLFHFFVQYSVAVLSKSVAVCWFTGCFLAYSIVDETCSSYIKGLYPDDPEKSYFLLLSTGMCNLRYIAFSIEYVWSCKSDRFTNQNPNSPLTRDNRKINHQGYGDRQPRKIPSKDIYKNHAESEKNSTMDALPFSFLDMLVYQMYYPLFYGGPIITYNDFAAQTKRPPKIWTVGNTKTFALGMIRYILWHVITDIILHFFYVSAVSTDFWLLRRLPIFKLLGTALAQVLFFCLKYVCMYGTPSYFASSDNMDIPRGPHCVFAKHRITDMWKYFDKGLHSWLVRYIYIPCGGSKVNVLMSILNSILPFAFVCFWHGAYRGQIYWAFLSWFGVLLESYALRLYRTEKVQILEARYLGPSWSRRIRAFFSAPLLFLLLTSNLYFLSGVKIGNLYWSRLYYENFPATALIIVFFYAGCQSCMEFDRLGVKQL